MPLTDVKCRNAKPREKPYKLPDADGLHLYVNSNGSRLWRFKYRIGKKEKLLSIGKYPEVSLIEAREARDVARKLIKAGGDPSLAKKEEKRLAVISAGDTFRDTAKEWFDKQRSSWTQNYCQTVMRRLEMDIFPEIGNFPISNVTTPQIATLIQKIEARGAEDVARRALQYCRSIFAYAAIIGRVTHNPANIKASDILKPHKTKHHAAISSSELPAFLKKLYRNEARMFRQTQLAVELMMLTFLRTNEMIQAEWNEIDFKKKVWNVPASRMKMKLPHIVPLSNQVIDILNELKVANGHRKYIFTSQGDPQKPISNGAILMALDRMGYRGQMTGHGFRALATSTIMEELGYDYAIPDVQLSHSKKGDVEKAYNRAKYIEQRTKMMQEWADYIEAVANEAFVPRASAEEVENGR